MDPVRTSEATDPMLPERIDCCLCRPIGQRYGFVPFGEVITDQGDVTVTIGEG